MNPKVFSEVELTFIKSFLMRFRDILHEDESLFGFTLSEFDVMVSAFPAIDLNDEGPDGVDNSFILLNNALIFALEENPKAFLDSDEKAPLQLILDKLKEI